LVEGALARSVSESQEQIFDLYIDIVYNSSMNKIQATFTLSVEALRLLSELAKKLGLSKSGVLELAIRRLSEMEDVK